MDRQPPSSFSQSVKCKQLSPSKASLKQRGKAGLEKIFVHPCSKELYLQKPKIGSNSSQLFFLQKHLLKRLNISPSVLEHFLYHKGHFYVYQESASQTLVG